jgi:hypothetical protein
MSFASRYFVFISNLASVLYSTSLTVDLFGLVSTGTAYSSDLYFLTFLKVVFLCSELKYLANLMVLHRQVFHAWARILHSSEFHIWYTCAGIFYAGC